MHVAVVSPYDPFPHTVSGDGAHLGGVERMLGALTDGLATRGHDVTLLCSTDGPTRTTTEGGALVHRVHRTGTLFRAPLASLGRAIPSDADVVHVPATYPFTTVPVLAAAHRRGIPSVLDFHFEPWPEGRLARLGAALHRGVAAPTYGLAQLVVVRSMAYANSAPSLSSIPSSRLRIVPNGVDPVRFHPDGAAPAGEGLLFVGRLVPYKGLDVLLDALSRMREAPPLRIAGDGPERARLEASAVRLGLDVTFLGHLDDAELPALYRSARLTVLPSVNGQEAFGMTLLESMACGTPVVASDLPGVAEVASLGGLTSPPGDAAALARTLTAALEPGALPRGRALAQRVCVGHTWETVLDQIEAIYGEATVRSGHARSSSREGPAHARARGHS